MTTAGWIALGLAVYGALSYAVGSILQAVGASRSHNTVSTLGHPLYLIGIALDISAWVAAMFALQHLAVYVVESVLAGSLAVTAVLAWLFLKSKLRHRDVVAIVCTGAALTTLAMSAGTQHEMSPTWTVRIAFCCAAVGVVILGWLTTRIGIPGLIAGVGGLSLGGAALTGRALAMPPGTMDSFGTAVVAIATEPLVWALLIFPINGMILYANALQHGDVGRVTAVHWTGEVVGPSVIALTLLGDTVRPGWEAAALIAGIATIGAAAILAYAPATVAVEKAAEGAPGTAVTVPPQSGLALIPVEAWRLAIPPEAHWPALQPPLVRGYGTFVWWGSASTPQPLWVPPDRTLTVPGSLPAWAGPQLPDGRGAAEAAPEVRRASHRARGPRHSARALPSGRHSTAA
ncbi:hypothetical protein [Actinoplanes sp. OR16]|uniref:hypothetical protein n=1 Tax=Actinoplanes sp. OR16 TaxID=946334 RepID=UPI000FD74DBB|nr:hypothetical protein [Actinoplanes sp. OR16]